jgi:hypothetical protein
MNPRRVAFQKKAREIDTMPTNTAIQWSTKPADHDYPAALSYLSLIYGEKTASKLVNKLRRSTRSEFKAKDIFRASGLPLLGVSNSHVKADQKKIRSGHPVSPLLLIRDTPNGKVVIADGYHRLCAVYSFDEDAVIPCKIA